ncbi:hypothetical protein ACFL1M_03680 [Patescibacteria group bacterium]
MSRKIESGSTPTTWESELRILEKNSTEFNLQHPETGEPIPTIYTPSIYTKKSPLSLKDADIRLLPASQLMRHEAFLRKGLRKVTFNENGYYRWNDAPMVGVESGDGRIMIIDGSTRLGRVQSLSKYTKRKYKPRHTPVFPVQIIDYKNKNLFLDIWETHHERDKLLTKEQVIEMALRGDHVEAKQTKFGVKVGQKVLSIAQTQGEIYIPMNLLIGISLMPEDTANAFSLMALLN